MFGKHAEAGRGLGLLIGLVRTRMARFSFNPRNRFACSCARPSAVDRCRLGTTLCCRLGPSWHTASRPQGAERFFRFDVVYRMVTDELATIRPELETPGLTELGSVARTVGGSRSSFGAMELAT